MAYSHHPNSGWRYGRIRVRRALRFRLRTLLLCISIVAIALALVGRYCQTLRKEREAVATLRAMGAKLVFEHRRRLVAPLGYGPFAETPVAVELPFEAEPERAIPAILDIETMESVSVAGPQFCDSHIRQLCRLPALRTVVLDTTCTTEKLAKRARHIESVRTELSGVVRLAQMHVFLDYTPVKYVQLQTTGNAKQRKTVGVTVVRQVGFFGHEVKPEALRILKGLGSIERIDLFGSPVTDTDLECLHGAMTLRCLDIGATRVSDRGMELIPTLEGLEELHVNDTDVSDRGLLKLKGMVNLRRLFLEDTKVTGDGLSVVVSFPRVEYVNVENTLVTVDCAKELEEKKEGLRIDAGRSFFVQPEH